MNRLHLAALAALSGATLIMGCSSSDNGAHVSADHTVGITSQSEIGPRTGSYDMTASTNASAPAPMPGITSQSVVGPRRPAYVEQAAHPFAAPNPAGITSGEVNGPFGPSDDDHTLAD